VINHDIIETQLRSLEITELTTLYQMLGNADEIVRFINELEISTGKKEEAKIMFDRMIKAPLRRQAGRIKLIRQAIQESINPK
jgi:hypothetical protein